MLGSFKKLSPEKMAEKFVALVRNYAGKRIGKRFLKAQPRGKHGIFPERFSCVLMRLSEWLSVHLVDAEVIGRRCRWMLVL